MTRDDHDPNRPPVREGEIGGYGAAGYRAEAGSSMVLAAYAVIAFIAGVVGFVIGLCF